MSSRRLKRTLLHSTGGIRGVSSVGREECAAIEKKCAITARRIISMCEEKKDHPKKGYIRWITERGIVNPSKTIELKYCCRTSMVLNNNCGIEMCPSSNVVNPMMRWNNVGTSQLFQVKDISEFNISEDDYRFGILGGK
ncbi:36_t:CDS:2, partial [Gigaspora rosea]